MLAPHVLPGLNPVLCRTREVAEAKLHELQMSPSVMARHAAYLASSSVAAEVVRPRFNSGILKYVIGAFAMVLALVTLATLATAVPSSVVITTFASALAPRSTIATFGATMQHFAPLIDVHASQAIRGWPR